MWKVLYRFCDPHKRVPVSGVWTYGAHTSTGFLKPSLCKPMLTATRFPHSDIYYIRPRRVSSWTSDLNLELLAPSFHTLRFSQYKPCLDFCCLDREFSYYSISVSGSEHASPAFLVPKADTFVLPCWVNDYRVLNANTVTDSHPLPRVDDILADCAKGKIWSVIDITNSFFQMRVHPDGIHLWSRSLGALKVDG